MSCSQVFKTLIANVTQQNLIPALSPNMVTSLHRIGMSIRKLEVFEFFISKMSRGVFHFLACAFCLPICYGDSVCYGCFVKIVNHKCHVTFDWIVPVALCAFPISGWNGAVISDWLCISWCTDVKCVTYILFVHKNHSQ